MKPLYIVSNLTRKVLSAKNDADIHSLLSAQQIVVLASTKEIIQFLREERTWEEIKETFSPSIDNTCLITHMFALIDAGMVSVVTKTIDSLWEMYNRKAFLEIVALADENTQFSDIHKILALSYMHLGNIVKAISLWEKLLQDKAHVVTATFHLGVCHYIVKDYETAHEFLTKAKEQDKGSKRVDIWLARCNNKLEEDIDDMERVFEERDI